MDRAQFDVTLPPVDSRGSDRSQEATEEGDGILTCCAAFWSFTRRYCTKASMASSSLLGLLCTACVINPSASSAAHVVEESTIRANPVRNMAKKLGLTLVDVAESPSQKHEYVCIVERYAVIGCPGGLDDLDDLVPDRFGDWLRRDAEGESFDSL